MSLGFRSAIRFTALSCGLGLPPAAAAVIASMLLWIASFAITMPSTTMSGSTPPLMVVTPRRLIWPPPPGAPEFIWIRAPGILPCSAPSIVCTGARFSCSVGTVVTALARFCCDTPVAWPVTTTASRLNTSCSRLTVAVDASAATGTWRLRYPTSRTSRVTAPGGTESENSPRSFVTAPIGVPTTVTLAPAMGAAVVALTTFPIMGRC